MNYLEICQRVHRLAQVQGQFGSVVDVGINREIAQIVSDCWVDIQKFRKDWLFMWKELSFVTEVGREYYDMDYLFPVPGTNDLGYFKLVDYRTSMYSKDPDDLKSQPVKFIEYEDFRHSFRNREAGIGNPRWWTYHPASYELQLQGTPDKLYTLTSDYYCLPQVLTENVDVPHINSKWHDLIVYKALADFGIAKSIRGLSTSYDTKYAEEIGQLMREQTPARQVAIRGIA
jgi:hypothetical protein